MQLSFPKYKSNPFFLCIVALYLCNKNLNFHFNEFSSKSILIGNVLSRSGSCWHHRQHTFHLIAWIQNPISAPVVHSYIDKHWLVEKTKMGWSLLPTHINICTYMLMLKALSWTFLLSTCQPQFSYISINSFAIHLQFYNPCTSLQFVPFYKFNSKFNNNFLAPFNHTENACSCQFFNLTWM
jgi:hypothetical protein